MFSGELAAPVRAGSPMVAPVESAVSTGLWTGPDGRARCAWCGADPLYVDVSRRRVGRAGRTTTARLFEKICLEGFQSGLSWLTILRKRENFRAAFADFDFERVARFDGARRRRACSSDAGIVRHRGKIESTINNARRALRAARGVRARSPTYFWRFEPAPASRPKRLDLRRAADDGDDAGIDRAVARTCKRRGWTFVGPTTIYAFMQAMGLVNDHLHGCEFK